MARLPYIPESITVHLGEPESEGDNVTVSFPDYIKNVASSELYPTWPESALRANIYAQISFAVNRVYTEYYRSLGYPFDITSSTAFDQAFFYGRDIFDNVSQIVDEIFSSYLVREGYTVPKEINALAAKAKEAANKKTAPFGHRILRGRRGCGMKKSALPCNTKTA